MKHFPLIKPYITQETVEKVNGVLMSGYLTEGPITKELEEAFKSYVGCKYAIAATSCTTGLEMSLRALGIGPGDEVIVPDYTYPATADVVAIVGAKIVIVDVNPETMLIDYDALAKAITSRTKALIPVSIFGNPLDYNILDKIRQTYHVCIIEDAACSLGAEYYGKRVGSLADISVFSMHPRKVITTGEGGMVCCNSDGWAEWMQSYKHFGMNTSTQRHLSAFTQIGTNYKLSDLLSAVGVIQMKQIDIIISRRRELANHYIQLLDGNKKIKIPRTTTGGNHSYQSFCIMVEKRDEIMNHLRQIGIEVQIGTYALHAHEAFSNPQACHVTSDMKGSRYAFDHCLTLPLYHDLSFEDQEYIINKLLEVS